MAVSHNIRIKNYEIWRHLRQCCTLVGDFKIPFGDKSVASKQIMVARAGEARTGLKASIIINTIRPSQRR